MAQVAGFLVPVLTGAGGASLATTIFGRLIASVALSALSRALAPRPKLPGLRNQQPMTGEAAPASFILGQYATTGHKFAPAMAQGNHNKWKQAWLSEVRAIGEGTGYGLVAVYINGDRITPEAATSPDGYGNVLEFNGSDQVAWVRWKDGTQTTADAMLLDKHGSHAERPWQSDMIGAGVAQAVVTLKRATSVWGQAPWPQLSFEVTGRALWDRRKDSTMGGSGAHRWDNAATWEYSQNPAVMIDNILRGVAVAPGRIWGVKAPGDRIFGTAAAANVCDQAVSISGGGTEPRYRANIEVLATDTPAEIIEELSKACNGALAQLGYGWRFRAGPPGLPVMSITDNDIIITREQDFDPFRQESEIVNAISARFTAPGKGYQPRETSEITNADWLAEDGGKRRHIVVDLPAVTAIRQARRVARAMVKDHRRQRVHVFALGPQAAALEPLDVIAWTSARNGYDGKSFEVLDIADDLMTGVRVLTVREVDPTDYDYDTDDDLDDVTLSVNRVRPDMSGVTGLALIDGDMVLETQDFGSGADAVQQFMRARNITPVERVDVLPTTAPANPDDIVNYQGEVYRWDGSAWTKAVDVGDLTGQITDVALFAQGIRPPEVLNALPSTGNYAGRMVFLTTDSKLYRHTGTPTSAAGFSVEVDGADIKANSITAGQVAAGAIGAEQIAAGSIAARELAVGDFGNLVINSELATEAGWSKNPDVELATGIAQTQRSTGWSFIVPSDADRYAWVDTVVDPGASYYMSAECRGGGSAPRQFSVRFGVRWFDTTGALISVTTNPIETIAGPTSPFLLSRVYVAPSNAVRAQFLFGRNSDEAGEAGLGYITSPMVRRMNGGELIVDGSVKANHLDTNSLGVAGLAIFGGTLASDDYETGSAGWRITGDGDAEFNSLIVRTGMLDANATGYDAEAYSGSTVAWGYTIASGVTTNVGGTAISLTVTDPDVVGKKMFVTFNADVAISRTVVGYARAVIGFDVGASSTAPYRAQAYIPTAGGVIRWPLSITRQFTAPAVPFTVITTAGMDYLGTENHSASVTFRYRSIAVRVRKDDA